LTEDILTAPTASELDRPVAMHALVFQADGDEVTVGRRDIDSYGVFPAEGAELIRRLAAGMTPREAAGWYHTVYGERVDIMDFLLALDELEFVRAPGEPAGEAPQVRWQRLGIAAFSPPAVLGYGVLLTWALVVIVRKPDIDLDFHNLFFSESILVVSAVLIIGQIPGLFLHEGFHALAARRLGLRSRFAISYRLYYIVFETSLDGLVSVPRKQRYLPVLAGMLADALWAAVLTLAADFCRMADGSLSMAGKVLLALAFSTIARFCWQCFIYLRTDLYVLISVVSGCVDLDSTARKALRNRFDRLRGRREVRYDETSWHPSDRSAAKWYMWLLLVGSSAMIFWLTLQVIPAFYHLLTIVLGRFAAGTNATTAQLTDSVVFLSAVFVQFFVIALVMLRDRRQARTRPPQQHVMT